MINKPFRFLKNLMRWYEKEGENVLREIRTETITPELWKKAENNFTVRGLPIPIYENHNEDTVVGSVKKIEAKEDGLYVTEHDLNEKGMSLVANGDYPLPSGDFVLHYDEEGQIIDIEVFGVSLVNNEGAKDVELVTMSKEGEKSPLNKIKIKGEKRMEKEELYALILDDEDFIQNMPDDVLNKILEVKGVKLEDEESNEDEGEEENADMSKEDEEDDEENEKVKKESKDKKEKKCKKGDEDAEYSSEEDEEDDEEKDGKDAKKKEKVSQSKARGVLIARMGKLKDAIAKKEYEEGVKIVPSSKINAERFVNRNYKDIPESTLISLALDQCSFFGGVKTETVQMKKSTNKKTPDEILLSLGGK